MFNRVPLPFAYFIELLQITVRISLKEGCLIEMYSKSLARKSMVI